MGGNAAKDFNVERLNKSEYNEICNKITQIIKTIYPDIKCIAIPAVFNKDSFGDVDVAFNKKLSLDECNEIFKSAVFKLSDFTLLGYLDNNSSSSEYSYPIECQGLRFQLDFMPFTPQQYDFAISYMSYNVFGNILGRVASKFGYSIGVDGLRKKTYLNENHQLQLEKTDHRYNKDVFLTFDWDKALKLFGLDPNVHKQGFESVEQVADYLATSLYFHPSLFDEENLNAKVRKRNAKNKAYKQASEYLKNNYSNNKKLGDFIEEKSVILSETLKQSFLDFQDNFQHLHYLNSLDVKKRNRLSKEYLKPILDERELFFQICGYENGLPSQIYGKMVSFIKSDENCDELAKFGSENNWNQFLLNKINNFKFENDLEKDIKNDVKKPRFN